MAQVKIGFNPQDRFMMALGNTLVVVTQDGNVFGADVVGRDVGRIFQVNDKEAIQYVFRLDKFHIDTTRAIHEDTDVVSFALKVGDQMFGPLIKHMGDVNNGDHSVGLQFGPIPIPSTAVPILLNYQILNSGHQDQAEIDNLLSQGADYLTKGATATDNPYAIAAAWIAKFFIGWLTLNCDGPVAIDQIAVSGATLDEWTRGASPHSETRRYNYESQDGCGSSPDYKVTWSIIRQ